MTSLKAGAPVVVTMIFETDDGRKVAAFDTFEARLLETTGGRKFAYETLRRAAQLKAERGEA